MLRKNLLILLFVLIGVSSVFAMKQEVVEVQVAPHTLKNTCIHSVINRFEQYSIEKITQLPDDARNDLLYTMALHFLGPVEIKEVKRSIGHHVFGVTGVCVAQDNKIISISRSGTVDVCDKEGANLCSWNVPEEISSVSVSHDNTIVIHLADNTMRVYDMQGKLVPNEVFSHDIIPAQSECTDKVLSYGPDNTIHVYDKEKNLLAICTGHTAKVHQVCMMQDNTIVSCSADNTVRIWDIGILHSFKYLDQAQGMHIWKLLTEAAQKLKNGEELHEADYWQNIDRYISSSQKMKERILRNQALKKHRDERKDNLTPQKAPSKRKKDDKMSRSPLRLYTKYVLVAAVAVVIGVLTYKWFVQSSYAW